MRLSINKRAFINKAFTMLVSFMIIAISFSASSVQSISIEKPLAAKKTGINKAINSSNEGLTTKESLALAQVIITKGDTYYQEKNYEEAIREYIESTKYLSSDDKKIKKRLGQIFTYIAQSYKRIRDRQKTAEYYKKALDTFTDISDKKNMARTSNTLAEAERYLGNYVTALNYSTQSLAIHKTIDDPQGNVKALMGSGIIYRYIGRYQKSIEQIHKAYLYFKSIKDVRGIAKSSNEMGHLYVRIEEYDQAKFFFSETLNIPEQKLSLATVATALREMAIISYEDADYEPALTMAIRAHKIYQQNGDNLKKSLTARIIANIYRAQQHNDKAITYYQESLAYAIENGNKEYQIKAQIPLASILMTHDSNKAIQMLTESLAMSLQIKTKDQTLYAYRTLRQTEEYRGNFELALKYAKQEIALTKAIQKEKDNQKLILTRAQLHSHKMEIELESLREKEKLSQLELAKKNNAIEISEQARKINSLELTKNRYGSLALTFLLLICLLSVLFLYRRFNASKERNKELDYLASRDSLTNCYNRRSLFLSLNHYFASSDLDDEYCIIMADIDYFKSVNDTYGHSIGDSVIKGVASILQSCIRQNDIVSRFGGEEFCIVLHKVSQEKAMTIAEDMRHKVEGAYFDEVMVTSSFGVTSLQFKAKSPAELIEQADLALYKSKSLGRNRVTLWEDSLKQSI